MDHASSVREAQRLGMTIEDSEWFVREFPESRCGAPTRIWCYIAKRLESRATTPEGGGR